MKEKKIDFLYNLLLIIFLLVLTWLIYIQIEEPQIVLIFHPYPEPSYFLPRLNLFYITLAFTFVIFYNYLFTLLGLNSKLINKINTLFFVIGLIVLGYLFYLNY